MYGLCLLLFLIFMPHGLSGMIKSLGPARGGRQARRVPSPLAPKHAVKKGVGR
jgi:branched-chain amino acid transport system permease protein